MNPTAPLTRIEGWPEALHALIVARSEWPFTWGSHDCCLFAADCIHAMTGVDLAAALRGYTTALGAARRARMAGAGPEDPYGVEAWPRLAFLPPVPIAHARRGDLIVVSSDHSPRALIALGICTGTAAVVPGPYRLHSAPMHQWIAAYAVG
jgi:hypothetical protein